MGEIDTKPIEPVQVAISMFGDKGDQMKRHSPSGSDSENEKERDQEGLLKELANYKLQLEAKDSAYMQALRKLEHYQKIADESSNLLQNSEAERDKSARECKEAQARINELEFKFKEMADQLSECEKKIQEQSGISKELKDAQGQLLHLETQLAAARDTQVKATAQAEMMENAANMEKQKMEELLKRIEELNDEILKTKQAATEADKEKCVILFNKDAEIELLTATKVQAQEQLKGLRKQLEVMKDLENQVLDKSILVDSLQLQLKQANEILSSNEQANCETMNNLSQLTADMEVLESKNTDQTVYIEALEMERDQLKMELKNANEEVSRLNCSIKMLASELEEAKTEINELKEREKEMQVEMAMLKSELHKGWLKIAAAEAAEEAKKENQRLKQIADKGSAKETENPATAKPLVVENSRQDLEVAQNDDELKAEAEERSNDNDTCKMIALQEYEASIRKRGEKANEMPKPGAENSEVESLKKELQVATARIAEFRTRAEQAITRADAAEKVKFALEDRLRKWRQQRESRRAALASLRQELVSTMRDPPPSFESTSKSYQPLGEILDMKF